MRRRRGVQIGTDSRGQTHPSSTGDHTTDRVTWKTDYPGTYVPHYRSERCVYFVHAPVLKRIKIGTTNGLKRRFRELHAQPDLRGIELKLLGCIDGGYLVERLIHDKFRAQHISREWFHDTILADIQELLELDAAWFGDANERSTR